MSKNKHRISQLSLVGIALVGFGLNACLSDDSDEDEAAAGKGSGGSAATAGSGGAAGNSSAGTGANGGGGSVAGAVCASPVKLKADQGAIASFDDYDGAAELSMWSFALGSDSSTGVFTGPFGYGDDAGDKPEIFGMVEGSDSKYALSVSDTDSADYGGGLGLWMSECLDASAFTGISFWVRGKAPTGEAKLSVLMQETTSSTPAKPEAKKGTCSGTDAECLPPTFLFAVTDTWTEVKVPWTDFMLGSAAGNPVEADGTHIWQIQVDVGLAWTPDEEGVYHPTPSDYDFAIDNVAFY